MNKSSFAPPAPSPMGSSAKNQIKSRPSAFLFVLCILVLLSTIFVSTRSFFSTRSLARHQEKIQELEAQIQTIQSEAQVKEYVVAQRFVAQQEKSPQSWSEMMKAFQSMTPVSVFYSSFSLSESGQWTVNGLADHYDAVADVLQSFNKSDLFTAEFIPSLTTGAGADGQAILSFSLRVQALTPEQ